MATPVPNLRVLDRFPVAKEWDLVSELFHRINRIIPETQSLLTIPPDCSVRDAIAQMLLHGYSQVPVVDNGEVLGVFSFRSFAKGAAEPPLTVWTQQKCAPGDLTVDEFLEQFNFASVTDEMRTVYEAMDRDNGVLIGSRECLIGILAPMDFLRYLDRVASPFVMISEIELAIRELIRMSMDPERIAQAARHCLSAVYKEKDNIPTTLEEMSFDNYQTLLSHGDSWPEFEPIFGGTRTRISGKLRELGAIRNDIFHFKREIRMQDHEVLSSHRDWLLSKVKQAELHRRREGQV
jgi:predicted transcriptional regulator